MMKRVAGAVPVALLAVVLGQPAAPRTLDIYFIDVEGGQSTLLVTPDREALLVDAGFPGTGTFQSKPGDPQTARDPQRILAAARDAGVRRIDYLLITHFHGDHDGGVAELSQLIPIRTFVDHGTVPPEAEQSVPGTLDLFAAYERVRTKGRHLQPKPGDRLPVKGVDVTVVSSAGRTIASPLDTARRSTPACAPSEIPAQEANENPRSTGIRVEYGKFKFLDVGDLTGKPLYDLVCPDNLIGSVDVYLVAHHGGADAADLATLAAFRPRVAVLNNGATKGGARELLAALHAAPSIQDVWQLHRSESAAAENVDDARIANLDDRAAYWVKIAARQDGSFNVTSQRTGETVTYPPQ